MQFPTDKPYLVYNPDDSFFANIDPVRRECEYSYASYVSALSAVLDCHEYGLLIPFEKFEGWQGEMPGWLREELAEEGVVVDPTLADFLRFVVEELGYDVTLTKRRAPVR